MKNIEQFGLIDLNQEEVINITGGDSAMRNLGNLFGRICGHIVNVLEQMAENIADMPATPTYYM